ASASDFETFLSLLTAQMRNQDPLKPMESTEFVAQLASFSSVEQQIRSNEKLDSILAALDGGAEGGLADWIGREVESSAAVRFDGAPLDISVTPRPGADRAVLVVRNQEGGEVARLAADPAAQRLEWNGQIGAGEAPPGRYAFSVDYMSGDEVLGSAEGRTYARVRELRLNEDGPRLVLEGGSEVAADDVAALRAPASG
ncbi:MAG: flagellar hook capping FlgD N-terminal domain-containing protein, partial [Pseudomonadota bacterium]